MSDLNPFKMECFKSFVEKELSKSMNTLMVPLDQCHFPSCGSKEGLQFCAGCKYVSYCSKDCQKKDWKKSGSGHKKMCSEHLEVCTVCMGPNIEKVRELIDSGKNFNGEIVIQIPMETQAKFGFFLGTESHQTPLSNAVQRKSNSIVKLLLESGVDPNFGSVPPLLFAAKGYQTEVAQLLLDHGANVNKQAPDGSTPLYSICYQGENSTRTVLMVNLLTGAGADVNAAKHDGYTPLLGVAHENSELSPAAKCVMSRLIQCGADVHKSLSNGMTPIHLYTEWNNVEAVVILLEAGADPHIQANDGRNALAMAKSKKMKDVFKGFF